MFSLDNLFLIRSVLVELVKTRGTLDERDSFLSALGAVNNEIAIFEDSQKETIAVNRNLKYLISAIQHKQ